MCCDAHTQGSRVKLVPLILYCASSWGYRVYICIFYIISVQHWEGGLHLFSYSSIVSSCFSLNPITVKVFFKGSRALFPLLPKCKTEVLEKRQVLYSVRSTAHAVESNRVSWSLLWSHCLLTRALLQRGCMAETLKTSLDSASLTHTQSTAWDHKQPVRELSHDPVWRADFQNQTAAIDQRQGCCSSQICDSPVQKAAGLVLLSWLLFILVLGA